jgi:hypothetical protein
VKSKASVVVQTVVPALRGLRQEDLELKASLKLHSKFQASLDYIARHLPQKTKKKKRKEKKKRYSPILFPLTMA